MKRAISIKSEREVLTMRRHKINTRLAELDICDRCPYKDACIPYCQFKDTL